MFGPEMQPVPNAAPSPSPTPSPSPAQQIPAQLDRALALVRFLRAGCPWDAAQTPRSLLPYLLEEAHEVADAVSEERDAELASELGDLLLNVAFQIVLAEERGAFSGADVVSQLEEKMRRRHPHLYGGASNPAGPTPGGGGPITAPSAEATAPDWEALKAQERAGEPVLSGLARGLDPLSKAHRIQERVSAVGFDWADARGAFEKVAEELEEVRHAMEQEPSERLEAELGDLLFAVVNLTRLAGTHAMHALQRANRKFSHRFEALEQLARERGIELGQATLEELDRLWDEVKRGENS
ncbi:MAG: nucleoside triphosphate pyrophosphohydrolase [Gemmatimonadetes bacterium]|nr:nucleoside triphosphate pyrophosphohydrolase [Gemmatimonadota bacterium]